MDPGQQQTRPKEDPPRSGRTLPGLAATPRPKHSNAPTPGERKQSCPQKPSLQAAWRRASRRHPMSWGFWEAGAPGAWRGGVTLKPQSKVPPRLSRSGDPAARQGCKRLTRALRFLCGVCTHSRGSGQHMCTAPGAAYPPQGQAQVCPLHNPPVLNSNPWFLGRPGSCWESPELRAGVRCCRMNEWRSEPIKTQRNGPLFPLQRPPRAPASSPLPQPLPARLRGSARWPPRQKCPYFWRQSRTPPPQLLPPPPAFSGPQPPRAWRSWGRTHAPFALGPGIFSPSLSRCPVTPAAQGG